MIDFIVIVADLEFLLNPIFYEPFEWKGLTFYPKFKKGILQGFESEFRGLRIFLFNNKIKVSNSLAKFYKDNNYSDFSYSELRKAIAIICLKFEIAADCWEIKKMEFGFCIETLKPVRECLDFFSSFKEREFEKMKHNTNDYGRKCFMYEYALKIYDKNLHNYFMYNANLSSNLLRVEFCYNQKRKLPKSIKTLADLLEKEKFSDLYKDFYNAFELVIYNEEIDFTNSTIEERMLLNASYNPNFLKNEIKIDKVEAYKLKLKIRQLKARFLKKHFKNWFLKELKYKYIELYCS